MPDVSETAARQLMEKGIRKIYDLRSVQEVRAAGGPYDLTYVPCMSIVCV